MEVWAIYILNGVSLGILLFLLASGLTLIFGLIKGPAVIELPTTTVLIPPESTCVVNEVGDYLLKYRS